MEEQYYNPEPEEIDELESEYFSPYYKSYKNE